MIRYREILRLRASAVSIRNIAYSCGCSKNTVQAVLQRAKAKGIEWPLPESFNDAELYRVLYPKQPAPSNKMEPDFASVHKELARKGVTLMLCWNEYCDKAIAANAEPYQYSAFCSHYRQWAKSQQVVMHIEWKVAQYIQVDWAGATFSICDMDSGHDLKVYIFVACLPYSAYLFAKGFLSMDQQAWSEAHIAAFEHFGGTTPIIVPDNCRTGITKNGYDELIVNESYRRLTEYYASVVVPARIRRARDKGSVEMSVNVVTQQALAPLRDRVFFSLADFNSALAEKIAQINERPFQKKPGSRQSVFLDQEKDALVPLPAKRYEITITRLATVQYNYHVTTSIDSIFYSVPYQYVKQEVEIRYGRASVAVYAQGERIAIHKRSFGHKGGYVTDVAHMPDAHKDYVEWTGDRFRKWGQEKGESIGKVIDLIIKSKPIEQQAYRSCRALISLAEKHGNAAVDEACAKALAITPAPSYKTVKMLFVSMQESEEAKDFQDDMPHAYLRGADYYADMEKAVIEMADEATMAKLREMKLSSFASAYRNQSEDVSLAGAGFDERLSMLVDAEYDGRRNNKRIRLLKSAGFSIPEANINDCRYDDDRKLDKAKITELSHCEWIRRGLNLTITGASGAGKSWLISALGRSACNQYYSVQYVRLPELLGELRVAHAAGTYNKWQKRYLKCDLLAIDDWLLVPLNEGETRDVLEIIEARHSVRSTALCSQFSPSGWHSKLGEGAIADAIIDRLIYNSHTIHIEGEVSMRKKMSELL